MVISYQKKLYDYSNNPQMIKNNSERFIQTINKYFKMFYGYKKEHSNVVFL